MYDDDGNPVRCPEFEREENMFEGVEDNKDIFHIKGDGYDVRLSLASGLISWKNVNPTGNHLLFCFFETSSKGQTFESGSLND